jgi:hypothetical protein
MGGGQSKRAEKEQASRQLLRDENIRMQTTIDELNAKIVSIQTE